MTDLTLFDFAGRVHRDDPPTSHAAAHGPRLIGHRKAVLLALVAAGERGLTGHEACDLTPCMYPSGATTRFEELTALGLVVRTDATRTTPSNHQASVWMATDEGRRVAAELRSAS